MTSSPQASFPVPRSKSPVAGLSIELTDQIITLLKPLDPEMIILFGSYAWGKPDVTSDVDLFIVKKCESQNVRSACLEAMRYIRPLIFKYKMGFDIVLDDPERIRNRIEITKDQFYDEVYKKGVQIYAKQNICS